MTPEDVTATPNADLRAENAKLRAALEKYGMHHPDCDLCFGRGPCCCGLDKVKDQS